MMTPFRPGQGPTHSLGSNTAHVSIAKPPEIGLADWMSHLRNWLDQHGIEPAGFKHQDSRSSNQTYEVSFADQGQADLFATEFDEKNLR